MLSGFFGLILLISLIYMIFELVQMYRHKNDKEIYKTNKKRMLISIIIVVVSFVISVATTSDDSNDSSDNKTNTEKQSKNKPEKKINIEYENAYKTAQDYMSMDGMSKKGLYDQLTSDAGDKFKPDAANYAVNKFNEDDYKKAAVKSAKNYEETEHMSADGLYDQLTSDAGEKFTPDQAKYALKKLNLK